ncbi:TPA: hypothetical protein HH295_20130 [Xanthomonas vasicola pv. zeae]|uniref:SWIM-type domain-containing protein n=2 Tax=Xanthomonas vasicola TaxID=56459 RepID=A0AAE8F8C6_XANVA|nr:hypothetical protein [Xanthomonas vasicola]AVQ08489.1 hypothetical protein C7V42_19715 [Xanthomonas vasicola pv. vasculorum]AZM72685.1 hypothetical protein CXP37_19730 [Xanthomonas vasicola pv. vasculorum]MDO6957227.1 hypothetical protein [Xanthomonas vasicola]MDO6974292.1 hypothetical protein [Xanthomonas vasicola]OWF58649.1 hypothetical protein B1H32_17120 [Xanthomonas vasicola pv. vasculorum]
MTARFSPADLDRSFLLGITTPSYYARGLVYADQERVTLQTVEPLRVDAIVSGSDDYAVELVWRNGSLRGRCDCPIGQQAEFCKHQVAVALSWARTSADPNSQKRTKRTTAGMPVAESSDRVLQHWLSTLTPQALQALILESADNDAQLRKRLLSQAQLAVAPLQQWRKAISTLLGRKRYMDWSATIAYSKRLSVLPSLLEQARQRDPLAALDLHEYAFKRLLAIYEQVDDSRGDLGERLRVLGHAHLEAARAAGTATLGDRLFKLRMLDQWSLLRPLQDYAALLSATDIARLQHAALEILHARGNRARRLSAESLLEDTARCGGNVDAMLEFFAHTCSSGWDHLEMARRCGEYGRQRQALEWLERGVKADPQDGRLLAALATAYVRDGFPEDALTLRWKAYLLMPNEETYLALQEAASLLDAWEAWRERALQALDTKAVPRFIDAHDTRISLLLAEGQIQRALELAADQTRKLPLGTWERLLPAAETCDPAAALRICHTMIGMHIERTDRQGYVAAIRLLPTLQRLYQQQGGQGHAAFDAELARLRQQYRVKRAFIELLHKRFPAP